MTGSAAHGSQRSQDGRFRDPWAAGRPAPASPLDVLKWLWEERTARPPSPAPESLPRATPELAEPRLPPDAEEVRVTWIGHASHLVQLPGTNVLTDPMFSERASPVQWAGPRRFTPPGVRLEDLPPIDAVVISHDHYDHLDSGSVRSIASRWPEAAWFAPLGYREWFARRGVTRLTELDWWQETRLDGPEGGNVRLRALPARHWTRRRPLDVRRRLWCSWALEARDWKVYFAGDSGYAHLFEGIGEREGGFDLALMPIGAYEPRWFMRPSHMNPEEAVQASRDLRARRMIGMHWGTFRLTSEPPLEPPPRARAAWAAAGLPARDLHIPAHGETIRIVVEGGRVA